MSDHQDDIPLSLTMDLQPEGDVALHQVAIGLSVPTVIIQVELDDDEGLVIKVLSGAPFTSHEDLASFLETVAEGARQGVDAAKAAE